jgi:MFS transporter, ACS family, DAL5 transporter family protein
MLTKTPDIGGIIAVYAFLAKDAPRFVPGYSICIAFVILSILACVAYGGACLWENKRRAAKPETRTLTEAEKLDLGDNNPEYRYLL